MRNLLLILAVLAEGVFVYFVIRKISTFLANGGFTGREPELPTSQLHNILVYGKAPETISLLESSGKLYDAVETPAIPMYCSYRVVMALSLSDEDNLMLCSAAKRAFPEACTVARCNDMEFRNLFSNQKADYTVTDDTEAAKILRKLGYAS